MRMFLQVLIAFALAPIVGVGLAYLCFSFVNLSWVWFYGADPIIRVIFVFVAGIFGVISICLGCAVSEALA